MICPQKNLFTINFMKNYNESSPQYLKASPTLLANTLGSSALNMSLTRGIQYWVGRLILLPVKQFHIDRMEN